jgi:hypothetical protein
MITHENSSSHANFKDDIKINTKQKRVLIFHNKKKNLISSKKSRNLKS